MAEESNPVALRQRLLADLKNVELRRKYLATRGPMDMRADRRFARRRFLIVELVRGTAGLAVVGGLGGLLGGWLLDNPDRSAAPFATAFQTGVGSALIAGLGFAVLGALGYVVFGDVVGDFSSEPGEAAPSAADRFNVTAIEFIGGATWGIVCGMLLGMLVALIGPIAGPVVSGIVAGAILGFVLAILAAVFRAIRGKQNAFAPMGPLPFSAYFFSAESATDQFVGARERGSVERESASRGA